MLRQVWLRVAATRGVSQRQGTRRDVITRVVQGGCVMGVSWVCHGCVMGVSWVCHGCVMGVSWVCHGCVMGLSWRYHGGRGQRG